MNKTLVVGAIFGLSAMIMAAYIDHGVALFIADKPLKSVQTALRYHQLYALFICVIALIIPLQSQKQLKRWLISSSSLFILGVLFFSGGIYASLIVGATSLMQLVPVGGLILMLGWCCLIIAAFIKGKSHAIN